MTKDLTFQKPRYSPDPPFLLGKFQLFIADSAKRPEAGKSRGTN